MKKSVVVILVLLAVVVLISPGVIGHLAEKSLDENLNWADQENQEIVVTSSGFDRGWFTSEGRHRVEVRRGDLQRLLLGMVGQSGGELPTLIIDTRLDHGLIPVSSMEREHGTLAPGLGSAASTLSLDVDGDVVEVPGTIYSDVGLAGGLQSRLIVDAGRSNTEDARFDWEATDLVFTADVATEQFGVSGTIGTIAADNPFETVLVGPIELDVNQRRADYGLLTGPASVKVESLSIVDQYQSLAVGPLEMILDMTMEDSRYNIAANFALSQLPTNAWGDADVVARLRVMNLDPQAMGRLKDLVDGGPGQSPADIERALGELLAAGVDIHLDTFTLDLYAGQVSADLELNVEESDGSNFNWFSLLLNVDGTANLRLPVTLVDTMARQDENILGLIGMGYLSRSGDTYTTEMELKDGVLMINGAPTPLAGLLGF